jgi:hypothetical protein
MDADIEIEISNHVYMTPAVDTILEMKKNIFQSHLIVLKYVLIKGKIADDKTNPRIYTGLFVGVEDEHQYAEYANEKYRCVSCRKNLKIDKLKCQHSSKCRQQKIAESNIKSDSLKHGLMNYGNGNTKLIMLEANSISSIAECRSNFIDSSMTGFLNDVKTSSPENNKEAFSNDMLNGFQIKKVENFNLNVSQGGNE